MSEPMAPAGSPFRAILQPFLDLARAPRALWAVNLSSLVEGFVYFGMLASLTFYFNTYGQLPDQPTGWMVGLLTAGITICMLVLGGRADVWGLRRTLGLSILLMLVGRLVLALAPSWGLHRGGLWTPFNGVATLAILLIVLGYGMYYPATYAAVRAFTIPATAGMGYAMLYAVMNLGGWLPTFMAPIRQRHGIDGAYLVYVGVSAIGWVLLLLLLNRRTAERSMVGRSEIPAIPASETSPPQGNEVEPGEDWLDRLRRHPLADLKFAAFLFSLMPVQTLFAYNYFILPPYVKRAFEGTWVGERYEVATQFNSLLIFLLCPIVAALTARLRVYTVMVLGTLVMALPTFLLAVGPTIPGLFAFLVLMTVGEALWQPRFLQFAAEIAPEGRTGSYMGVAQFPWFITKMVVPLYSGAALARWCPAEGVRSTGTMWLIFGMVALVTPLFLIVARRWLGVDVKPAGSGRASEGG